MHVRISAHGFIHDFRHDFIRNKNDGVLQFFQVIFIWNIL